MFAALFYVGVTDASVVFSRSGSRPPMSLDYGRTQQDPVRDQTAERMRKIALKAITVSAADLASIGVRGMADLLNIEILSSDDLERFLNRPGSRATLNTEDLPYQEYRLRSSS